MISERMGFSWTDDLRKYLGVPILHKRATSQTFKFIIDKVNDRLSSWKARSLSLAGRATLAKSVIQSIPTYVMQSTFLPKNVCEKVDRKCRGFIWGDEVGHRKVHLVSWDKCCKRKKLGGLGLRMTHEVNKAFMLKASWCLFSCPLVKGHKGKVWV